MTAMPFRNMPIEEFTENALEEFHRWLSLQTYVRNTAGHLVRQGDEFSDYVIRQNGIRVIEHNPDNEPDDVFARIRLELHVELIWYYPETKKAEHADSMLALVTEDLDIVIPQTWYPDCGYFTAYPK